jgi:hypothetical protein
LNRNGLGWFARSQDPLYYSRSDLTNCYDYPKKTIDFRLQIAFPTGLRRVALKSSMGL